MYTILNIYLVVPYWLINILLPVPDHTNRNTIRIGELQLEVELELDL